MDEDGSSGSYRECQEWLAVRKVEWRVKRERVKEYNRRLMEDIRRAKRGEEPMDWGEETTTSTTSTSTARLTPIKPSVDTLQETVITHLTRTLSRSSEPSRTYNIGEGLEGAKVWKAFRSTTAAIPAYQYH